MENSILKSTKKMLGLAEDYTAFDHDVVVHINSVFADLDQMGIGPEGGYEIDDQGAEQWAAFETAGVPSHKLKSVRSYVFLRVKHLFDPPTTGYLKDAAEEQIRKAEWRLNVAREESLHPLSEFVEEGA